VLVLLGVERGWVSMVMVAKVWWVVLISLRVGFYPLPYVT